MKGLSVYGTTKRAIRYYSRSLARENRDGPVVIGTLNPGMVVTDLLTGDMDAMDEGERNRFVKIVNIIGERVETVAPFLVDRVLRNDRNGVRIEWLTGGKAMMKFLAAPFSKRNLFNPPGVEPI
jgi:short-subunit dehydrogenase